jgi:nitrogen regulatory protein PII
LRKDVMKKLEALIGPDALDRVVEMLEQRNISNLMISDVAAKDLRGAHIQTYRGHAYAVDTNPEVKVEAVVPDNLASATAYAILNSARGPGRSCRARVLVAPVNEVIFELADDSAQARHDSDASLCENAAQSLNPSRTPPAAQPQSARASFPRSAVTWAKAFLARHWHWGLATAPPRLSAKALR